MFVEGNTLDHLAVLESLRGVPPKIIMKYFETFAGVGGFSQAMPDHFECVGMSEIDKYASAVLKYHYQDTNNYGDIQTLQDVW
jgi:site-specific DNA-cytosine methylase